VSANVADTSEVDAVNIRKSQSPTEDEKAADDAWLDEALAQSFPASDPVPHFHRDPPAADHDDPLQKA
jgi:hypothetical protein